MQQKSTLAWISIICIVALAALIAGYLLGSNRPHTIPATTPFPQASLNPTTLPATLVPSSSPVPEDQDGVMCTMDVKLCPDGSAVGRSGPNCEFTPCPGQSQ